MYVREGMRDGYALRSCHPCRHDRCERGPTKTTWHERRARLLVRKQQQRARVAMMNVDDVCRAAGAPNAVDGEMRHLASDRAPAAERADELDNVRCKTLARRKIPNRAPCFDPSVGVEQAPQQIEPRAAMGIEIAARYEFFVAADAPQSHRAQSERHRVRLHAVAAGDPPAVLLHDAPIVRTGVGKLDFRRQPCAQASKHFICRSGEARRRSAQVAIAEQRAQNPRIDRQLGGRSEIAARQIDPKPAAIADAPEHCAQSRRRKHARRRPVSVVNAPKMLVAALGAAAVGERHTVQLAFALRKDSAYRRRFTVDRRQRVADREVAHPLPRRTRPHLGIERLRFPHARASGDDDEVAFLQACRHPVEIAEAGRDAGHFGRVVAVVQELDSIDDLREELRQLGELLLSARALLGDVQHLRFGFVEHVACAATERVVRGVRDLPGGRSELAQDRALAHDRRVVPDIGGGRHVLHERPQIRQPADIIELLHRRERFRDRHDVRRLAVAEQPDDVRIDQPVRLAVEIGLAERIADAVGSFVVEQQAAQHRLLRLDRVRRQLQRFDFAIVGHRCGKNAGDRRRREVSILPPRRSVRHSPFGRGATKKEGRAGPPLRCKD